MRLGEALVKKELLTARQLEKALNAQLIFGAHLGTCLLELGYVDENSLGTVLAELNGVPYASRTMLTDIPDRVIQSLPASVAERRLAIPFGLDGRQLRVAMVEPRHLPTLDELAFASGCRVEAWVTPEVRVFQALEHYYGTMRRQRYVMLARTLDEKEVKAAPRMAAAIGGRPRRLADTPAASAKPTASAMPAVPAVDWIEEAAAPVAAPAQGDWLAAAAEELCRADDIGRMGKIVIHHASRWMPRCALFSVRGGVASMWEASGLSEHRASFRVVSEPLFTLSRGEPFYHGEVPPEERYRTFFRDFGLSAPRDIFVAPIHIHDRLAAVFYGDAAESGLSGTPHDVLRLLQKLALAMGLLIVKKQIRLA